MSAPGRPKREYRSAQHEGRPVRAPGRPKREYRSAQHEGSPVCAPRRGFTLLELLVALAILALLSLLGYRALASLADSEVRLTAETRRWRALDQLYTRLEADLREALPREARIGNGRDPAWLGELDSDGNTVLSFSRAGPEFALDVGSAGQRLGYRMREGAVEVLYWPYLDNSPAVAPTAHALADGIAAFRIEYLDRNGAMGASWPIPGDDALPRAVRVLLTLAGGETVERWIALR
jgi:general secretion pathway protein J